MSFVNSSFPLSRWNKSGPNSVFLEVQTSLINRGGLQLMEIWGENTKFIQSEVSGIRSGQKRNLFPTSWHFQRKNDKNQKRHLSPDVI